MQTIRSYPRWRKAGNTTRIPIPIPSTSAKDVKWHDGEPFTANDVVFTLTEILDAENQSEIASNYEDIISMVALDDYTFVLGLKAPNVAMLDYLTVGILPRHLWKAKTSSPTNSTKSRWVPARIS